MRGLVPSNFLEDLSDPDDATQHDNSNDSDVTVSSCTFISSDLLPFFTSGLCVALIPTCRHLLICVVPDRTRYVFARSFMSLFFCLGLYCSKNCVSSENSFYLQNFSNVLCLFLQLLVLLSSNSDVYEF